MMSNAIATEAIFPPLFLDTALTAYQGSHFLNVADSEALIKQRLSASGKQILYYLTIFIRYYNRFSLKRFFTASLRRYSIWLFIDRKSSSAHEAI